MLPAVRSCAPLPGCGSGATLLEFPAWAGRNRSLEWLSRRRDGESMALIAWRDGVSPQTVKRATAPYGPFPAASRHLGRTITASTALDERTQRWVDARRRGERVSDIARREGVAHQLVSRYTAEAGPFPSEEVVQEWVQARQAGQTIAAIATTYAAPARAGQSGHPPVGAVSPARAHAYRRAWSAERASRGWPASATRPGCAGSAPVECRTPTSSSGRAGRCG